MGKDFVEDPKDKKKKREKKSKKKKQEGTSTSTALVVAGTKAIVSNPELTLQALQYNGFPRPKHRSFYEFLRWRKEKLPWLEQRWQNATGTFNLALDILRDPSNAGQLYRERLQGILQQSHQKRTGKTLALPSSTTTSSSALEQRLQTVESKSERSEYLQLLKLHGPLVDLEGDFTSLFREYEGIAMPSELVDTSITSHHLSYFREGGDGSIAERFKHHSNSSIWIFHHQILGQIQAMLQELKKQVEKDAPGELMRLPGIRRLAKRNIKESDSKLQAIQAQEQTLIFLCHMIYGLMYERLNLFLSQMPTPQSLQSTVPDGDLFLGFNQGLVEYLQQQRQQYPELAQQNKPVDDLALAHCARERGREYAIQHYLGELTAEAAERQGYDLLIEQFNQAHEVTKMIFDCHGLESALNTDKEYLQAPVGVKSAMAVYLSRCRLFISGQLANLAIGKTLEEVTQLANGSFLQVLQQMAGEAAYGQVNTGSISALQARLVVPGRKLLMQRLFSGVSPDSRWFSVEEKEFLRGMVQVEKLRQDGQEHLARVHELQVRYAYRFSANQLFKSVAQLLSIIPTTVEIQERVQQYFKIILRYNQTRNDLSDVQIQGIKLLSVLLQGEVSLEDLGEEVLVNNEVVGYRALDDLSALFPREFHGNRGGQFHRQLIYNHVRAKLGIKLPALQQAILQRNVQSQQLETFRLYFRIFRIYFPGDNEYVVPYLNGAANGNAYFQSLLNVHLDHEYDLAQGNTIQDIFTCLQQVYLFADHLQQLRAMIQGYLTRFEGTNDRYWQMLYYLGNPYIDENDGTAVDPFYQYGTKIIDFVLSLNPDPLCNYKEERFKALFFVFLQNVIAANGAFYHLQLANYFQQKLANYIQQTTEQWQPKIQRMIDYFGSQENRAKYRVKGFAHFLADGFSQAVEKGTLEFIEYLQQQGVCAGNFTGPLGLQVLEELVDQAIEALNQTIFVDRVAIGKQSDFCSDLRLLRLVDAFLPSRQVKARLFYLRTLINLNLQLVGKTPGPNNEGFLRLHTKDFILYLALNNKLKINRHNLCYSETGPDNQYLAEAKELFASVFKEWCWSHNIFWLLSYFASEEEARHYFIKGLQEVLEQANYDYASEWLQTLFRSDFDTDEMLRLREPWEGEIALAIQTHIGKQIDQGTLPLLAKFKAPREEQQFYRFRLVHIFQELIPEFWLFSNYDEKQKYQWGFGFDLDGNDQEAVLQRLEQFLGIRSFSEASYLAQQLETYVRGSMTHPLANYILGDLGVYKLLEPGLQQVYLSKWQREQEKRDLAKLVYGRNYQTAVTQYQHQHDLWVKNYTAGDQTIAAGHREVFYYGQTLLLEALFKETLQLFILSRGNQRDCYVREEFDRQVDAIASANFSQEQQRLKQEFVQRKVEQGFVAVEQQFWEGHFTQQYLAQKTVEYQQKHKGQAPTEKQLQKHIQSPFKKAETKTKAYVSRQLEDKVALGQLKQQLWPQVCDLVGTYLYQEEYKQIVIARANLIMPEPSRTFEQAMIFLGTHSGYVVTDPQQWTKFSQELQVSVNQEMGLSSEGTILERMQAYFAQCFEKQHQEGFAAFRARQQRQIANKYLQTDYVDATILQLRTHHYQQVYFLHQQLVNYVDLSEELRGLAEVGKAISNQIDTSVIAMEPANWQALKKQLMVTEQVWAEVHFLFQTHGLLEANQGMFTFLEPKPLEPRNLQQLQSRCCKNLDDIEFATTQPRAIQGARTALVARPLPAPSRTATPLLNRALLLNKLS